MTSSTIGSRRPEELAAETLRALALDEALKWRIAADPVLLPIARRVAGRYIGGETPQEALGRVREINARGQAASVEYAGESCRDAARAVAETEVFVALAGQVAEQGLNCSISLDLSHIGSVVDAELGLANAVRVAEAAAGAGQEMMISMEGSDRTDLILWTHGRLCERFDHVGITVQARLHRTAEDLPRLLERPGRIRLVKGAFLEPESVAYPRGGADLRTAYLRYARALLDSGHACSIATHDQDILDELHNHLAGARREAERFEFETLLGLGPEQLRSAQSRGYPVREYVIFGTEWWLYVCNRIAEDPSRLFQALADAVPAGA
ncbi:proline dehydrogenase family protein [Streptosporangium roseum]|uniref:Proline dehydrogenase n=1 Tax=Streptosporangium roseum (strain ATCC 12428 / DSM 43021 / JCM 3005 / KCTC 9067 / NCIMB 10171 / NRRL 2505 / NI 9100) TaxID=479432 RepID=D2BDI2_STRRD|nr:proline dehydrogenase family protein [Streptosporangium roseum]ACZ86271.1 proline dehydrogenase [Streptosporangium roseum DSM 43021]